MCFLGVKIIFMIMILFEKGTIKDLVLSLDIQVIEAPIYLFEFVNDITNEMIIFEAVNTSLYLDRYSQFEIDVNEYFLNATTGFWTYKVFETQISPLVKTELEIGKMKLTGEAFTFTEYNGQSEDFITYK